MLHPQVDSEPRSQEQPCDPEVAEKMESEWFESSSPKLDAIWGWATASHYAVLLNLVCRLDGVLISNPS